MSVALRNTTTGVLVTVSDETAANLGSEWESADAEKPKRGRKPKESDTPAEGVPATEADAE